MSENLDLVRLIYAAWERGDYSSAEWAHPDIEFVIADGPDPRSTTGVAGAGEEFRAWLSAWAEYRVEAEDYREIDGYRVLVLTNATGRGKASGLQLGKMRTKGDDLFHVRDHKVTRLALYIDADRALADLGLKE
jgi:ketosteroid isomerase-like protein